MSPPTANTRVVEIRAGGSTADWDSPDTAGDPKFQGSVGAVYTERRERRTGVAETFAMKRTLTFLPRGLPAGLKVEEKDVVAYIWRNQKRTGEVLSVEELDMPGRNVPGSIRVVIEPQG